MNLKKIIILLIICIIFIVIALFIIIGWKEDMMLSNELDIRPILNEEYTEYIKNTEFGKVNKLQNETTFFTVLSCIDKYMGYNLQQDSEKLYNLLSENYKNENKITKDNILNKLKIYLNGETFSAEKIYEYHNNENIDTYFVYGKTIEDTYQNENPKKEVCNIVVQLDKVNRTFYIILDETADNSNIGKDSLLQEIKNNQVNTYTTTKVAETQLGMLYLSDYKSKMQENINQAYDLLDEEYKNKRYNTLDKFKNYIESINILTYISSVDCTVEEKNGDKTYTVRDQYGNIYIFKETAILEYTVQLDDYTLENELFSQTYKNANNRDKGILNVDKFFKMINMQDYTSAYTLLDEQFKQNNFKTQAEFENYMKTKTFRYNKVEYKEYSNQISSLHTYKLQLTDATEESQNIIEFNIIIKLLEETNFVMSFTV